MLRNTTLALLVVLGFAASSQAAIIINRESAPTTGVAGSFTDTLTAVADAGEKVIGFDFVGNGSGVFGFNGQMGQVNPAGQPTVFADNNAFITLLGGSVDNDSQFKVLSTTGTAISPSEAANKLWGAFSMNAAAIGTATNSLQFVQIAHVADVTYNGTITVRNAQGQDRLETISGTLSNVPIPEPTTFALLGLAVVGCLGLRRRS